MLTVALHGFMGSPAMWDGLAQPLHAPWLPGHGPTPSIPETDDFDAIIDRLAEALPRPPWTLVGYSLGARTALALTLRHPSRVRAAVLVGGTPGLRTDALRAERRASDALLAQSLLRDGLERFAERWEALALFETQRALPEETRRRRREQRLAHRAEGLAWSLRAMGTGSMPSYWDALGRCQVPLRWVTGSRDEKFTAIAREACASCPSATHTVIEGAGHDVALERGVEVLRGLL